MAVKKTTKKQKKAKAHKPAAPPDIRAHLEPTPANLKATIEAVRESLRAVPVPAEPVPGDLVEAMLHIIMAEGLPCGIGQESRRRLRAAFVNRNEFRLTEAFELEGLVADLEIPRAFDCCQRAREAILEVYNDQNDVTLEFLREASVTDRNMFFQRMPVLRPETVHFISGVLTFEEIIFSDRSTLRMQQRVGLDPKNHATHEFLGELGRLIKPYGHLPLDVGLDRDDRKPIATPELSAAGHLVRLTPPPKGR